MPNAVFVRHPVSSLAHRCPPPALACRRRSMPTSSAAIAVHGSRRKPSQSSPPICCLCHLSSLSLVAVVSCRRPLSFQFIVRRCRHHRFLSAVDITAIYRLPSPASCHRPRRSSAAEPRHRHRHQWSERRSPRANLSAPVAPVMFFTLLISHRRHAHSCCDHCPLLSPPLPTHKHPDKRCDWTAADGPRHEMNGGSTIDRDVIDGKRHDRWMAEVAAKMGAGGRCGGRR